MAWTALISSGPPNVGEWEIETGVPGDGALADFDRLARDAVVVFLGAFDGLVRAEEVDVDLMWLDADGRIARVEDAEVTRIDGASRVMIPEDVDIITSILVLCALDAEDDPGATWHHEGLEFQYTCVVDVDDQGRASPVDSLVGVSLTVDCWSGSRGPSNSARLGSALQEWERRVGKPISVWSSSVYRGHIGRYGFDNMPPP